MKSARTKCRLIWVCTSFLCDHFLEAAFASTSALGGDMDITSTGSFIFEIAQALGLGNLITKERRYAL